jgi:hypothetical protein
VIGGRGGMGMGRARMTIEKGNEGKFCSVQRNDFGNAQVEIEPKLGKKHWQIAPDISALTHSSSKSLELAHLTKLIAAFRDSLIMAEPT